MKLALHDPLATHVVIEVSLETLASACLAAAVRFVCPNQHHHGIDFKNPFTMSKRSAVHSINRRIATPELVSSSKLESRCGGGGAYRDRTDDLMLAKQPLSQLS